MNRKSRSVIPDLSVILFVLVASLACFSGRALAQKTEDLSKEAAQKATTDQAAAEKAAASKAAWEKEKATWEKKEAASEAHRKAEEAAERKLEEDRQRVQSDIDKFNCERLPYRIERMQDLLSRLNDEEASLPKELEEAGKTWAQITSRIGSIELEIRQAQEDKDEKLRGQLQDWEKSFLNTRTSVVERRDKMSKRLYGEIPGERETLRTQIGEATKQLADCKKKQAKAPPAPPLAPGPTTPPPGKEVAKDECDGLKEKIRTLQDSLRKRQAEPAAPKQDLETIRKQIDELLNRLADCPKQEPIDAQFDCLKSKFPGIQHSSDKKDAASDPASKREFAWDTEKQAWIDKDTKESICPPSGIDSCLVGTWECTSFKLDGPGFTGGTGFRVTFKSDGTETVDYSSMQPIRAALQDVDTFTGKASAKISTDKGVAKIEEGKQTADLGLSLVQILIHGRAKCPGLGPGGLGSSKDNNSYKCTEDSLEYQTTWLGGVYGGHHRYSYTVKLKKVK